MVASAVERGGTVESRKASDLFIDEVVRVGYRIFSESDDIDMGLTVLCVEDDDLLQLQGLAPKRR